MYVIINLPSQHCQELTEINMTVSITINLINLIRRNFVSKGVEKSISRTRQIKRGGMGGGGKD